MATDTTMACTRGHRGLQAAAALTVFFFTSQALAQTPAPAPAPAPTAAPTPPVAPATPGTPTTTPPRTTQPPTATPPRAAAPPTPATPAPAPDDRALGTEIPQAVEAPPGEAPPPTDAPPTDVGAPPPPPEPVAPPPEPVGPPPPPAPAANDGNLVVKDQEQADELRRKGLGVMIAGGVIMVAGAATSIAFTIRGTQYEGLLVQTDEAYNRNNCAYKMTDTCSALGKQSANNREGIEFGDRATKAAGAAIAAGVIVTVVGGIIYRLGIKKLRSGDIARVQMTPAIGRGFGGLSLTGRF